MEVATEGTPWELTTGSMNENLTAINQTWNGTNTTVDSAQYYVTVDTWSAVSAALYTLICITGMMGNGLVIFVVLRYAKMKTVTNMYILNLAVADLCFLIGLPFLIITSILRNWIFGFVICKLFYISTSINWYTSVFSLTAMSADRYLAVCHPITSMRYRTPIISRIVCACVWTASLLAMLPMVLYTTTTPSKDGTRVSCTIEWPPDGSIPDEKAFIWYALMLGFTIPVCLICVFYTLVVVRLRSVGPKKRSKEKKRSHRKVTKMVLTVIAVYVICWLPYWVYQIVLNYTIMPTWGVALFQIITVLSYANSVMNPILYAFLSDNFRKSFAKAFKCADSADVNRSLHADQSMAPGRRNTTSTNTMRSKVPATSEEELETLTNGSHKVLEGTKPGDNASQIAVLSPAAKDIIGENPIIECGNGNGHVTML